MDADEREVSPEQAFSLLGNDTRIGIIQALWKADEPLSFSDLHDRVEIRDSGQFNYHLNKLVGLFVRQVDGKYELTFAGSQVIGAILSGTYTQRAETERFELDANCPDCGTELTATYEEERVTIRCETCDEDRSTFGLPPGAFEGRDESELQRTFERWLLNVFSLMADGVCLRCSGKTIGSLITESEYFYSDQEVGIEFVCERCGDRASGNLGTYLLRHPAVVAFHYDHGIDLTKATVWELEWLSGDNERLVSEDPLVAECIVTLDGDELTLTVDEELAVHVGE
ncbi:MULTISPECIES: helix-turn-helix domain-containing protein [unclassified Haladaptatus]|uniref:ArsR/SmtB family transcription factor n=1 Tax=unclassified Haladaptatus TaxID=2622732 RepID=UPI00209C4850|nr:MULTISPECIES: helix-turn-helix domain-containing protein [unclassified Haladaptatus]MCO8242733.1 winged helix-turn-helix domain-containing protein [Haladaptatus sp. AB643]MCO8252492.1 winged helix-turn-helix domain-containing protein [Haladaptatus sp. AB618]